MDNETNGKRRGLNGMWVPIIAVSITIVFNLATAGWTSYLKSECVSRAEFDTYRNEQIARRETTIQQLATVAAEITRISGAIDRELKDNDKQADQIRELEKGKR